MEEKIRRLFHNHIHDMFATIFFYDRKSDREFPPGTLEEYIRLGTVSVDDLVEEFRTQLKQKLRMK